MAKFLRRDFLLGGALLGSSLLYDRARAALRLRGGSEALKAPELIGAPSEWLNTDGKALRLYGPDGILETSACCLIDFWEYTCVNCIRTFPYLRAWNERYHEHGLTIVGIHTPEFDFAREKENVAAAAERFHLAYPLLIDSHEANWNAYDNHIWPRHYLLNPQGIIVADHAGEGGYGDTEEQIQRLLLAAHPELKLPKLLDPVRGSDRPGAVCYPSTPEIYCGTMRGLRQFGSPEGFQSGHAFMYSEPSPPYLDGHYYAGGSWIAFPQSIRHARETTDPFQDEILLSYKALEANAVLRPLNDHPFDLYVLQDGQPVDPADKGPDLRYTPEGKSYARVDQPRMYGLTANRKWGRHELRLGSTSANFEIFSFSFASCEVGGKS